MLRVNLVRSLLVLASALLLAGCLAPGPKPAPRNQDGPPTQVPTGLANLPDPQPRKEPRSARGNPQTYTVFGKTYRVLDSADGYRQEGGASWYGKKFHGRATSSGEPFDMFKLTAAHKSLPIPTYVRVTNLDNGRKTVLRVNDRGPFHGGRIIDVSYAAAVKLGFASAGTARVRVEVIGDDDKQFALQAGAFKELTSADQLKSALGRLTGLPAYVVRAGGDPLYRVRLGPVKSRSEAERVQALMLQHRYSKPLILPYVDS